MRKNSAIKVHKLALLVIAGLLMGCNIPSQGGDDNMSEKLADSEEAATDAAQATAQNAALDSAENATSGLSNTARTPLPHEIPHV